MTRLKLTSPVWFRVVALVVAVAWLLWLPIEDNSERWVLFFAVLISVLIAARWCIYYSARRSKSQNEYGLNEKSFPGKRFLIYLIVGVLTGLTVTPVAVLLMALKSGLHGHVTPEFTSAQVFIVLQRTPIWIIGGLLAGVGVGLLRWTRKTK